MTGSIALLQLLGLAEPGGVLMILGNMRSGKTLLLTYLALQFKALRMHVWANYDLYCADGRLENIRQLVSCPGPGLFALDEWHQTLNARGFEKSLNTDLSMWFVLVGKSGLRMACTLHSLGMIDINQRRIMKKAVWAEFAPDNLGRPAAKIAVYRALHMGDQVGLTYEQTFHLPHHPALYRAYDTLDKRVVLPLEGRAQVPLVDSKFMRGVLELPPAPPPSPVRGQVQLLPPVVAPVVADEQPVVEVPERVVTGATRRLF